MKMTGVDDPFEEPLSPELTIDTASQPVERSTERILQFLGDSGLLRG